MAEKKVLKGLTLGELQEWVQQQGLERFRANQIYSWLYAKKASSFAEMTNLSKSLREQLSEVADVGTLSIVQRTESQQSGTVKYLLGLRDDHAVEAVYIPEAERRTVCLSSQVGCPLACRFCATGQAGFVRNLEAWEIVEQLLTIERDTGERISNVVFMGMGEPLLNYDAVIRAAKLISDEKGIAVSHRHVVISTAGLVPQIKRMADQGHRFRLAISLNAPDDDTRSDLMPINRRFKIREVIDAAKYYYRKTRRRVTFEYVLLAGVNDRRRDAERLRHLLGDFPCKINLIPYNETVADYRRPTPERIERFRDWLKPLHAPVIVRWSRGDDIRAACGQLWSTRPDGVPLAVDRWAALDNRV